MMTRHRLRIAATLIIHTAFAVCGVLATAQAEPLQPFTATYEGRMLFSTIKATRQLQQTEPGIYELSFHTDSLWVERKETSRHRWQHLTNTLNAATDASEIEVETENTATSDIGVAASEEATSTPSLTTDSRNDTHIVPLHYHMQQKTPTRKRSATLTFDWQTQQVTNDVKDRPWKMAIDLGVLDPQAVQLQLRSDLKRNPQQRRFEYHIADGGTLKQHAYVVVGTETLHTKLGDLNSVKVMRDRGEDSTERATYIWFAEDLDYLISKVEHKEGGKSYDIQLVKANIAGQPALGSINH